MVRDKYKDEPTVEIDPDIYAAWLQARENAARWKAVEDELRQKLDIGKAHAGTINGVKVLTHRPIDRYREADIRKRYPELVEHFMKPGPDIFDVAAFARKYPERAEEYRTRQFRPVEKS